MRTLEYGVTPGRDIYAHKRAIDRLLKDGKLKDLESKPTSVQDTFQKEWTARVEKAQAKLGLKEDGSIGPVTHAALLPYFDAKAKKALDSYAPPVPTGPVEPKQGWMSLDRSLWDEFSLGRNMGLSDLGTYNPNSVLPGSGRPSDHALHPALAFDLGGDHDTLRAFFKRMVGRDTVGYVIFDNDIWSQAKGLHAYSLGGHDTHVHVSGVR